MKSLMELEIFMAIVKLPDGVRFKEWMPESGCFVASAPSNASTYSYTSTLAAIERISDGAFVQFEITALRNGDGAAIERGKIHLCVAELANAVDKAIAELEQ